MNIKEAIVIERLKALHLKSNGLSRREIADRMGLSERQVKRRLANASAGGNLGTGDMTITGGTIDTSKLRIGMPFKEEIGWGIIGKSGIARAELGTSGTTDSKIGGYTTDARSYDVILGGDTFKKFEGSYKSLESDYFSGVDDVIFPDKDERLYSHEDADKQRNEVTEYFNQKYKGKAVKILNLSDLHIPFTDYKTVAAILKKHNNADILMINGDLLDLFAVSKYAKDKEVALKREIDEGRDFLEYVSKNFKDVVITDGNHERRLKHYVTNMIPTDMQFLFPQDILQVVVSGEVLKKKPLKNIHVVGSWWVKLFDVIFAHPDNYSGANLKTVQNTSEHFSLVKNVFHRMCIIGHTHRAGWLVTGDIKLMETGCLCFEMDYHNGSKFTRTKWTKAYSVVHIDSNGRSDFNDSTVYLV